MIFVLGYALIAIWIARREAWRGYENDRRLYEAQLAEIDRRYASVYGRERAAARVSKPGLCINASMGFLFGFLWPLILSFRGLIAFNRRFPNFWLKLLTSEPSRERKQRRLDEAKKRIAKLEQELEL